MLIFTQCYRVCTFCKYCFFYNPCLIFNRLYKYKRSLNWHEKNKINMMNSFSCFSNKSTQGHFTVNKIMQYNNMYVKKMRKLSHFKNKLYV